MNARSGSGAWARSRRAWRFGLAALWITACGSTNESDPEPETGGDVKLLVGVAEGSILDERGCVLDDGSVAIAMLTDTSVSIDEAPYPDPANGGVVLARFNHRFEPIWTEVLGTNAALVEAIDLACTQDLLVMVDTKDTVTVDGAGPITGATVVRYARADGTVSNALALDDANRDVAPRTIAARGDHLTVAGTARALVDEFGAPLAAPGPPRGWVQRLDLAGGSSAWETSLTDAIDSVVLDAVGEDGDSNVLVLGRFTDALDANTTTVASAAGAHLFVAKLGTTVGDALWTTTVAPDDASSSMRALAVTRSGDPIVTTSAAGSNPLATPVPIAVLAHSGATGKQLKTLAWSSQGSLGAMSTTGAGDRMAFAATFPARLDMAGTTLAAGTHHALAIATLDPLSGQLAWARQAKSDFGDMLRAHAGHDASAGNIDVIAVYDTPAPSGWTGSNHRKLLLMQLGL